jgi:DNA-binding MarR family transcriptional regulator
VHTHIHTDTTPGGSGPDITLELAELFTHTARRLRRGSIVQLAPLGLTYAQARVLRLVAAEGRPLRMADLAAQLDVVPRSVTTMVDALEEAGFVARLADPGDRRSVLVTLSDDGRRLLEGLETARRDSAEEVFGGLDPDQRNRLLELLEDLCERGACVSCCGPTEPHGHHGHPGHGHHDHDHDHDHGHRHTSGGGDR